MDIAYVFAHPDDEAFAPCMAMARQCRAGHRVHLLTLTRGGASRLRHELQLTRRELEAVRSEELRQAARLIGCHSLVIGDFPDGGLTDIDPRRLTDYVFRHLLRWRPELVVTLPPNGLNGHDDHCAVSAATTTAACQARDAAGRPRRLAYQVLSRASAATWGHQTHGTADEAIDARLPITDADRALARAVLDCHRSQGQVIDDHRPLDHLGDELCYRFHGEHHRPALEDPLVQLP